MKKFDLKNLQGSKRTLRSGSYAAVLVVAVLAVVILINLVVQALPSKWTEFDISTSSLFTLRLFRSEKASGDRTALAREGMSTQHTA